jgi:uncharacterized cupin superfamily protein
MSNHILNIDQLDYMEWGHGEKFACKFGLISRRIGADQLGYNVTVVPAGKKAFPFHNHRMNEEMFFIIEGKGEIRIGDETYPVREGDVIACPTGGPETAHQIINTSDRELKYLAVSTTKSPEVAQYPDSNKCGVIIELDGETEPGMPKMWRLMMRMNDTEVDYWDGEE